MYTRQLLHVFNQLLEDHRHFSSDYTYVCGFNSAWCIC